MHGPVGTRMKKGPWTPSEDAILEAYVKKHGERNWNAVQKNTSLLRCGKSCRLRWINHLSPSLKKGPFTKEEENLIIELHYRMGNKWSQMAAYLPGRTDNEIKNYWNTRIKKCERTDTLVYPADVCEKAANEYQHDSTDFSLNENPDNGLYVPDFTCGSFSKDPKDLSYTHLFSDVPIINILGESFASRHYGFMDHANQVKTLKEPESSLRVYNEAINGSFFDSHCFSSGHFSASRSTTAPSKMELPSFQYVDFDPNNSSTYSWTSAMRPTNLAELQMHSSAATLPAKSECLAPRNSSQSEEPRHEAHALSSVVNQQLSVGTLSSSVGMPCDGMMESSKLDPCEEYWEQDPDISALIGCSVAASPICPASPAQSPAIGSSETIVLQHEQGDVSPPYLEDFRSDAQFPLNRITPSISEEKIDMLLENDSDTERKPVSWGTTTFS